MAALLAALCLSLVATHRSSAQLPGGDSTLPLARPPITPPAIARGGAAALRGGQWVYQSTLESGTSTTIIGTQTISVTPSMYAGSPAWLLLETRSGDGIFADDSLYVDFTSLHPVYWNSTLGEARVEAEFRSDTVYAGITSPVGRRSMIVQVPDSTVVNAAMLETLLRLEPLGPGWEDSTTVLSLTLGSTDVLRARLSVIGDDQVRVPAGTFDCWVVAVHADSARGLYWVSKQNPILVRSTRDVPSLGGAQLVTSLVSATP